MSGLKRTSKLWQSMINTDLTPDEFIKLTALGLIREQSLRKLVSNILRQELKTFADIIDEKVIHNNMIPSLEARASQKRSRGRPRDKEARFYTQKAKESQLPTSLEDLIDNK